MPVPRRAPAMAPGGPPIKPPVAPRDAAGAISAAKSGSISAAVVVRFVHGLPVPLNALSNNPAPSASRSCWLRRYALFSMASRMILSRRSPLIRLSSAVLSVKSERRFSAYWPKRAPRISPNASPAALSTSSERLLSPSRAFFMIEAMASCTSTACPLAIFGTTFFSRSERISPCLSTLALPMELNAVRNASSLFRASTAKRFSSRVRLAARSLPSEPCTRIRCPLESISSRPRALACAAEAARAARCLAASMLA